jgi:predicted MFS family arabinose efflux permease
LNPPATTGFDERTIVPILSMVAFTVLAQAVYAVLPLLVGATVERLDFTAQQAGLIGAADMFGATISALIISLIISRGRWRLVLNAGLFILVVADVSSGLAQHFSSLLISRVVAGVGEGIVLTIAYISMGETRNPVRAYGFATTGYVAFSAPGLYFMPFLVDTLGLRGVFWGLAALTALAALLVRHLPDRARLIGISTSLNAKFRLSATSLIGLAGVLSYFMAQGGVWAYLDRIGMSNQISTADVATALAISSIGGLLGALLATWLDSRYGRLRPLLYSTLCTVVSLLVMSGNRTLLVFAAMASLFNFAWNFSVPFQFGALALIDPSRRTVALGGGTVNAGLAAGPVVAAAVIGERSIYHVNWMGMILSVVSFLLFARILLRAEADAQ